MSKHNLVRWHDPKEGGVKFRCDGCGRLWHDGLEWMPGDECINDLCGVCGGGNQCNTLWHNKEHDPQEKVSCYFLISELMPLPHEDHWCISCRYEAMLNNGPLYVKFSLEDYKKHEDVILRGLQFHQLTGNLQ